MYLTVFAAFRLYGLLDPLPAFALMIIVCGLSCALALLQNSRALAVAAFAGGFAVPLLLSTGQGSHVGLFSYYTLLNLAISAHRLQALLAHPQRGRFHRHLRRGHGLGNSQVRTRELARVPSLSSSSLC